MSLTRRQFAFSLVSLGLLPAARCSARGFGEREEIWLGKQGAEGVEARYHVLTDPAVQRVGESLAAAGGRPTLPWSFRVIDLPEVNAVSLPGGPVYLYAGLLRHIATDEGLLAAVLGHEIGHVEKRHAVRQIERGEWNGVGAALLRQAAGGDASGTEQLAANLELLHFTRDQENEADDAAIRLMRRTNRNPEALVRALQLMGRVGGDPGSAGWLRTHPSSDARVERVRDRIVSLR